MSINNIRKIRQGNHPNGLLQPLNQPTDLTRSNVLDSKSKSNRKQAARLNIKKLDKEVNAVSVIVHSDRGHRRGGSEALKPNYEAFLNQKMYCRFIIQILARIADRGIHTQSQKARRGFLAGGFQKPRGRRYDPGLPQLAAHSRAPQGSLRDLCGLPADEVGLHHGFCGGQGRLREGVEGPGEENWPALRHEANVEVQGHSKKIG